MICESGPITISSAYGIEGFWWPRFEGPILQKENEKWTIGYLERGQVDVVSTHSSEEEACEAFIKEIITLLA